MDNQKQKQPTGSLKISQDVLTTIARVSAMEVNGVDSLAEPPKSVKVLGRKLGRQPIQIELTDDFAEIDVELNLKFGAKINEVCPAVQQNIKDNIQTMTGMAVSKVNVTVDGITFPSDMQPEAKA